MFGAMGDKDKETKLNKLYNIYIYIYVCLCVCVWERERERERERQIYQNKIVNVWLVLLWDNKYNFYFICRSWENQLQYLIFIFFFKKKRFEFNLFCILS